MSQTGIRDKARRNLAPRLLIAAWDRKRGLDRRQAAMRRALGRGGRIELYFAFDDPYSALAVPQVLDLERRYRVDVTLYPVVSHGISGDPDEALRRAYSVKDARRLAQRLGWTLSRSSPIPPGQVAFLAAWAEGARKTGTINSFSRKALALLWLSSENVPEIPASFKDLYREVTGEAPPASTALLEGKVAANERRMTRKGHWETPAARVDGEWFFAHERIPQIEERLTYLGWRES